MGPVGQGILRFGVSYDHWLDARKVCVIGAGTMGSGIAALLANVGFEVSLLDLTLDSAEEAFDRARQARPPHFYTAQAAEAVRLGSITHNLDWAFGADWVCEAIIEKMDAKRVLFAELDGNLRDMGMITTNTSGLQISLLCEGRSEEFRKRFLGTHFFNPPRYLKLLELIPTEETDSAAVKAMSRFLEEKVARRVVVAKDTPGFIANRFGMWSMINAIHATERLHLPVEDVDLITGPFLGRPRSGSFRLADLVGLDIMEDIARNLYARCPDDPYRMNLLSPNSMAALIGKGWVGDKAGQGYYKKEGKELVAFDLQTMAYRMRRDPSFPSLAAIASLPLGERIGKALSERNEVGEFLRHHLVPVLRYAAYLREEVSHSVLDFDRVMMWGFGWEQGPFAMIDAIGPDRLGIEEKPFYQEGKQRSVKGGYVAIPKAHEYKTLKEYKILLSRDHFTLRDLGDEVTAICITTKMGTINLPLVDSLYELLMSGKVSRFVLTSEARSFSAGFDLNFFSERIARGDFAAVDDALKALQALANKIAEFPSVSAVFGHCLGAGFELASRCSVVVANAECQIGLPEAKVGLIPGGGGTALMRLRNQHLGAKGLAEVVGRLTAGAISPNADEARNMGFLRPTDVTVYHPDRLIWEAKKVAKNAEVRQEEKLVPPEGPLSGMIDTIMSSKRRQGEFTEHDEQIGLKLKTVFAKSTSFEDALERERQVFVDLCGRSLTALRIRHMVENGKPLRN